MKVRILLGAVAFLVGGLTASAQDEAMLDTVVVTANYIDQGDFQKAPSASLKVRADFVVFELSYVNSTLDANERMQEMQKMFDRVVKAASRREGISLRIGEAGNSASVETTTFEEAYQDRGSVGRFSFVVRVDTTEADTFKSVRERVETFVNGIDEVGRSQSYMSDEQFLGVRDLTVHRAPLIAAIWKDIYLSAKPASEVALKVNGLESKTLTRPSGPLELELYIPYTVQYETEMINPRVFIQQD